MTKKRFTINDCRVLSNEQVFKILNQLTEENEQLKMKNDNLIKISAMIQVRNDKLSKENTELIEELCSFKPIIFETENGATTLYEKRGFDD